MFSILLVMTYGFWFLLLGISKWDCFLSQNYAQCNIFLCLAFQFTLACIKIGRPGLAERAVLLAEKRISNDKWPEYYDTRTGRFIGKQARLYQTWSIAGYLTSKMLLDNPELAAILTCDEDLELLEFCICGRRKSPRTKCSRLAARSQILV